MTGKIIHEAKISTGSKVATLHEVEMMRNHLREEQGTWIKAEIVWHNSKECSVKFWRRIHEFKPESVAG